MEVTVKSPLGNKLLGSVPTDFLSCERCREPVTAAGALKSLSAKVLGSITEQSRPLGTTVSVGVTNSLQAAALFLPISRHLSYAHLPNSPFCAVILPVLLLLMVWCYWCSIVLPHVLNCTWVLPELFLFMDICLTVVLYGRTEGCYLLLHHLVDDTFLGNSDFLKLPGNSGVVVMTTSSPTEKSHYTCAYICVCTLSHTWLFVTPWTVNCQAPLSMEFSRQEYWSGLPFLPPGDLPNPGIEPTSLVSAALACRFFTNCTTWEAYKL